MILNLVQDGPIVYEIAFAPILNSWNKLLIFSNLCSAIIRFSTETSLLNSFDNKILWIRKLLENKDNLSSSALLEELKTDVYLGEIFVQTPRGKVIKLVENATPIDFAYAIHSDIGNTCKQWYCTGTVFFGETLPQKEWFCCTGPGAWHKMDKKSCRER